MKIAIKMHFDCVIGCLDFERIQAQEIKIKLKIKSKDFIDYSDICDFIFAKMTQKKFIYIEDALVYFESRLKKKFSSIISFKMKISKPQIFGLCKKPYHATPSVSKKS